MKRVLVVDDERPIIETIELMVRRHLSEEFEVVGDAPSGRVAIEKAMALAPDIVLMDVWMPGISGLDAVREIRSRGLACVFILVTAYERFDIAREAMELGVLDYLLKPVARDKLAAALRAAASFADRRFELERREIAHREKEERLRSFVEEAFLRAIMMDDQAEFPAERYKTALGITEEWALIAAAGFQSPLGTPDPGADAMALYERFQATVRYKTKAITGPYVAGFSAVLLPLSSTGEAIKEQQAFDSILKQTFGVEESCGSLRIVFASAVPFNEANRAWARAFTGLLGSRDGESDSGKAPSPERKERGNTSESRYEEERTFLTSLLQGDVHLARLSLERILAAVKESGTISLSDRFRITGVFVAAYREFEARGFLARDETRSLMNMEDLCAAEGGLAFSLAVRSRFSGLSGASLKAPRWSPPVMRAIAFVKENYGKQISLETAAEDALLSANRLSRLFVEETGRGFSDFLTEVRMDRAKELLSLPGASIKQVSAACGYPDPNYFSRLFKKVTGFTPSAFSSDPKEGHDAEP